jgi:midasin
MINPRIKIFNWTFFFIFNRELYSLDDVVREGYMLIAERARSTQEREEILRVLTEECKTAFSATCLYKNPMEVPTTKEIKTGKTQLQSKLVYEMTRYEYADLLDAQRKLRAGELLVEGVKGIVLTENFQRMWALVGRCITYNEPGLLIGETGCGKTAVCQLIAAYRGQRIRVLNCHQSIETADIIGSLRPIRGNLPFSSIVNVV